MCNELGRDRTPPIVRSTTSIRSARLETFLCTIYVPLATGCDRHIAFAWKPLRRTDIAVASRSVASREPCREGEPVSVHRLRHPARARHNGTSPRRAASHGARAAAARAPCAMVSASRACFGRYGYGRAIGQCRNADARDRAGAGAGGGGRGAGAGAGVA